MDTTEPGRSERTAYLKDSLINIRVTGRTAEGQEATEGSDAPPTATIWAESVPRVGEQIYFYDTGTGRPIAGEGWTVVAVYWMAPAGPDSLHLAASAHPVVQVRRTATIPGPCPTHSALSVADLHLSPGLRNALYREHIITLEDLAGYTRGEILDMRTIGVGGVTEIIQKLAERGLSLAPEHTPLRDRRCCPAARPVVSLPLASAYESLVREQPPLSD